MTTDSKTGDIGSVMKRGIAVLGLVAVVGLVEGCIIDTDPGPPAVCLDSSITFDWVITANGISRSCAQVGATTVSIMVDNMMMIADFDCSAFAGTTQPVIGGVSHAVSLALSDAGGNILSELAPTHITTRCGGITDLGTVEFSLTQ